MQDWRIPAFLTVSLVVATASILCAAWSKNAIIKQDVKALFTVKAPATVLGIFWMLTVDHTVEEIIVGGGGGAITDLDDQSAEAIANDLRGWVQKLSNVASWILLSLIMILATRAVEKCWGGSRKQVWTDASALLIGAFHMTPVWPFKSMMSNLMAHLKEYLGGEPAWAYTLLFAILILLGCSAFRACCPKLDDQQPYCHAVFGLMGASMAAGVAYSFDEVATTAAGDKYSELKFQLVYTTLMTIVCYMAAVGFHSMAKAADSDFKEKLMEFVKLIPGFVAAWGWSALMGALAKEVFEKPDDKWLNSSLQAAYACCWCIIALLLVLISLAIQTNLNCYICIGDQEIVSEVFTTIGGLNIGWQIKTWGISLYDAMGQKLSDLWLVTLLHTILVPILAGLLVWVLSTSTSSLASELQLVADQEEESSDSESDVFLGLFKMPKAFRAESSDDE